MRAWATVSRPGLRPTRGRSVDCQTRSVLPLYTFASTNRRSLVLTCETAARGPSFERHCSVVDLSAEAEEAYVAPLVRLPVSPKDVTNDRWIPTRSAARSNVGVL
jgi:hypothetical protein